MRTEKIETLHGSVATTGAVTAGRFGCTRTSAGLYTMFPPPGKRLLAMMVTLISPAPQWSIVAIEPMPWGVRVVVANAGGTVNVDNAFQYSAVVAA